MNGDMFCAQELSSLLSGGSQSWAENPTRKQLQSEQTELNRVGKTLTPGSIGLPKKTVSTTGVAVKPQLDSKDIWDENEVDDYVEDDDPRPAPIYSFGYRQKVSSEDMFLGMSGKCNSIGHCDECVVKVELPETLSKDIEMSFINNIMDLRCPRFKLKFPLPVSVNDKSGSAHFDVSSHVLTVVLPIIQQFPL